MQIAGPRNRWAASIRCSLPDHVFNSRVLIVDHNYIHAKVCESPFPPLLGRGKLTRQIMEKNIEKFGLCSDTVSTPKEALAIYQNDPLEYNVVVMDRTSSLQTPANAPYVRT